MYFMYLRDPSDGESIAQQQRHLGHALAASMEDECRQARALLALLALAGSILNDGSDGCRLLRRSQAGFLSWGRCAPVPERFPDVAGLVIGVQVPAAVGGESSLSIEVAMRLLEQLARACAQGVAWPAPHRRAHVMASPPAAAASASSDRRPPKRPESQRFAAREAKRAMARAAGDADLPDNDLFIALAARAQLEEAANRPSAPNLQRPLTWGGALRRMKCQADFPDGLYTTEAIAGRRSYAQELPDYDYTPECLVCGDPLLTDLQGGLMFICRPENGGAAPAPHFYHPLCLYAYFKEQTDQFGRQGLNLCLSASCTTAFTPEFLGRAFKNELVRLVRGSVLEAYRLIFMIAYTADVT